MKFGDIGKCIENVRKLNSELENGSVNIGKLNWKQDFEMELDLLENEFINVER